MEEAQKRFSEITAVVPPSEEKPEMGEVVVGKQKKGRRTIKTLKPKSK
jgi:hypothetical protein